MNALVGSFSVTPLYALKSAKHYVAVASPFGWQPAFTDVEETRTLLWMVGAGIEPLRKSRRYFERYDLALAYASRLAGRYNRMLKIWSMA